MVSPTISQPFAITTVPRQSKPVPILVSKNNLDANSNELNVAFSKYSISKFIINPTPKLIKAVPIPSNLVVTAFDGNQVYATMSGSNKDSKNFTLYLNENTKFSLSSKIVNVLTNEDNITIAILENGTIQNYHDNVLISTKSIPMKQITQVEFIDNKFALIIADSSVALYDIENWIELRVSTTMYEPECQISQFENKIYKFSKTNNTFHVYDLITLNEVQSIGIPFVKPNSSYISFQPTAENQICLAIDNEVYYLDLYLGSVLSHQIIKRYQWFQILSGSLDGSFIIGLSYNHNSISLDIINIEKGNGSLKESLGKGFQNFISRKDITETANNEFVILKTLPLTTDEETVTHNYDYDNILKDLTDNVKDITKFDDIFFTRLDIKKDFYTESDRFIINQLFLSKVIELILNNFSFDNDNNNNDSYPRTLTYLLTHPLFPIANTRNLLSRFKNCPRLYKQAIVTCPNLPLNELLMELFSINNNELSLDISLRILQDYNKDLIRKELKVLPKIDIHNFIKFIIFNKDSENINDNASNNDNSDSNGSDVMITSRLFQLVSLVIDSIGLFALDKDLLNQLSEYVNNMVNIIEQNAELWYLLDSKMEPVTKNKNGNHVSNSAIHTKQKNVKKVIPPYSVEYIDI